MKRAFDATEEALGTVTICINNAGISRASRLMDADKIGWRERRWTSISTPSENRRDGGATHEGGGKERRDRQSRPILSSASAVQRRYAVAKAGVMQLTKVMGFEFARDGIRANAIAPGYFATEMNSDWLTGGGADMRSTFRCAASAARANSTAPLLLASNKAGSTSRRDLCGRRRYTLQIAVASGILSGKTRTPRGQDQILRPPSARGS